MRWQIANACLMVGNFDTFYQICCPRGREFDILIFKCQNPCTMSDPLLPLGLNINKTITKIMYHSPISG